MPSAAPGGSQAAVQPPPRRRGLRAVLERLDSVEAALAAAFPTREACAAEAVRQCLGALGAQAGSVVLWDPSRSMLELAAAEGYPEEAVAHWRRIPADAPVPLAEAARTGEPVFVGSRDEWALLYPHIASVTHPSAGGARAALPLVAGDGGAREVVGAVGLSWRRPRRFTAADRACAEAVARRCAAVLRRARTAPAQPAPGGPEEDGPLWRRRVLRDVLAAVTEGRLVLCAEDADLPPSLPEVARVVLSPATLQELRRQAREAAEGCGLPPERAMAFVLALGEAAMNAVVHGGGGEARLCADPEAGTVQGWVSDSGPGLTPEQLPSLTLQRGFSTRPGSMGMGFVLMLESADRLYLLTGERGTAAVVEQTRVGRDPSSAAADPPRAADAEAGGTAPHGRLRLADVEALVEHGGDAVIALDRDRRFVFLNRSAEGLLGRPAADLLGRIAGDALPEASWGPLRGWLRTAEGGNSPVRFEQRHPSRDTWLDCLCAPAADGGMLVLVRDVTARRRAEEDLRDSERRLNEAQAVARIGSWEFDIAAGRITWSREMFRLLQFDPDRGEPDYPGLMRRYHPDDVPMHDAVVAKATRDGLPYEFDIRAILDDGSLRWMHATGRGVRDEAGAVVRLIGTVQDVTDRKLAEERERAAAGEARVGRSRLEALVGSLQGGVLVEDESRRIQLTNRRFCKIFGVPAPPEALVGADCSGAAEQHKHLFADPDAFVRGVEAALAGGVPVTGEELRLVDGRVLERDYLPVRLDGTDRGNLWFYRDVTGRYRAAEELLRSRERFRAMAESSPLGVFVTDGDGACTFVNPAWARIAGMEPAAAVGDGWTAAVHPEDRARVSAEWLSAAAAGAVFDSSYRFRRVSDGEVRWLHVRSAPMHGGGRPGGVAGRVGVIEDVTERREAEARERAAVAALRRSEERMRALVEASATITWVVGALGEVTEGDAEDIAAWRAFTGQSAAEVEGLGWRAAVHPDDVAAMSEAVARSTARPDAYVVDYRVRRHDGQWRWLRSRAVPVFNADGTVREWVGTSTDITEARAAEEERARLAARDHLVAETLRASLIPPLPEATVPGFAVAALHRPASEEEGIGGDFYDVFPLGADRWALVVGDVMGHGLDAALSIAEVRFALRGVLRRSRALPDPADILAQMNDFLLEAKRLERRPHQTLVSANLALLDARTGDLWTSAAGGYGPLLLPAAGGESSVLDAGGLILGAYADAGYGVSRATLRPGDLLAITTDGLPESRSPDGSAQFGLGRMAAALREAASADPSLPLYDVAGQALDAGRHFRGGAPRQDDVCLLLLRRS